MEVTFLTGGGRRTVQAREGSTVLEALREAGCELAAPCGGQGRCGKCTVYIDGQPALACRTVCREGMTVRLPDVSPLAVELGEGAARPDPGQTGFGVACDVGTTTVACQLVDMVSGRVLASLGEASRQRTYGADVISRIRASTDGHRPALTAAVRDQLAGMLRALCEQAGAALADVHTMACVGNPTMCHLLAGLAPDAIGAAPFAPVSYFGETVDAASLDMPFAGTVYIAPAVSGYVGGDVAAGLLAVGMDRAEEPWLYIDVGTNGEMALGRGERILCCSAAAGPAFEGDRIKCGMAAANGAVTGVTYEDGGLRLDVIGGGEALGLCGSGLIDAAAVMLDMGVLDKTGRLLGIEDDVPPRARPYLCQVDGENAFRLAERVYVTQSDVRALQLGKGAVAAGIQVLRRTAGDPPIARLLLAGGFGSYIRPESAARIGLIPADLLAVTEAAGNAALRGAVMALVPADARTRLARLRDRMAYVELSGLAAFSGAYLRAMDFPG